MVSKSDLPDSVFSHDGGMGCGLRYTDEDGRTNICGAGIDVCRNCERKLFKITLDEYEQLLKAKNTVIEKQKEMIACGDKLIARYEYEIEKMRNPSVRQPH